MNDIVEILKETGTDGIIATNTTLSRERLITSTSTVQKIGQGGLSGEPLKRRSNEVIAFLRQKMGKNYPIVGVGGIMTVEDALEKLHHGADLVQLYTGFIYQGPSFVKRINKALLKEGRANDKRGRQEKTVLADSYN